MSADRDERVDASLAVVLDALLSEANVTRAAKKLGVTQSAASHRLRQLRETLGDALLVPGEGGLVRTARAQAIAGPLQRALADLAAAMQAGRPFDPRASSRTFKLAFRDYGEFVVLGQLLGLLAERAPAASIVVQTPDRSWGSGLAAGELDLYIGIPGPAAAGLRQKLLMREPFVVVARQGHPGFGRRLSLEQYLAYSHIVVAPEGTRSTQTDRLLAERNLSRRIALRVPSFVSSPFLVARTDLLLTVPLGLAATAARHVKLQWVPLPTELAIEPTSAVMVWHDRVEQDTGHRWLRALVLDAVAALKRELKPSRASAAR